MSNISGAVKNRDVLQAQAGLTTVQSIANSGADMMRAALVAKAGLTTAQAAALDGPRLIQLSGGITF